MTLLCLSVVLCALFITVFNSRTANRISTNEPVLDSFQKKTKEASQKLNQSISKTSVSDISFSKKESSTTTVSSVF